MRDLRIATVGWPFGQRCYMFLYPVSHRNSRRPELPQISLGLASINAAGVVLPPGPNGCLWEEFEGLSETTALKLRLNFLAAPWTGWVEDSRKLEA